jgi:class I lanthipeptide synthase
LTVSPQSAAIPSPLDRPWRPLLHGEQRALAERAIAELAKDLRDHELEGAQSPHSLFDGSAGLALLSGYLAQTFPAEGYEAVAVSRLREAAQALPRVRMGASLLSGFAGVGWVTVHLAQMLPGLGKLTWLEAIDDALVGYLGRSPWRHPFDLCNGLVGFGVYARERLPEPAARRCLELVVERLEETAEPRPEGVAWWTPPELTGGQEERFPNGYLNLGLAHGAPGSVAVLGLACAHRLEARARPLLEGAVEWLLAQQISTPAGPRFPFWTGTSEPEEPARLAWCYGEPGIAAALLVAARAAGVAEWEEEAIGIALRAAELPEAEARVVDAALCHGAAGLGHIFNRLYQATGEPTLADSARFWFARTLELREPESAEPGFLTGAAGIALALAAATGDVEPAWDRVLLLS